VRHSNPCQRLAASDDVRHGHLVLGSHQPYSSPFSRADSAALWCSRFVRRIRPSVLHAVEGRFEMELEVVADGRHVELVGQHVAIDAEVAADRPDFFGRG
jgi:hypothetical protein